MTHVAVEGEAFVIDGEPTYRGRAWRGHPVEGLLLNSRMVQATFDDENPETCGLWAYPDTGVWDPERNIREFIQAMPVYREQGLLAVTVNLQGGNPQGYRKDQPWLNSAFEPDGTTKPAHLERTGRVLQRADELGMVVILGVFYFGQDQVLCDEAAVVHALDGVVDYLLKGGHEHVLLEVNNECDVSKYVHEILMPARVAELVSRVRDTTLSGRRLLVGTSFRGRAIPSEDVANVSDFLLIHGNGVAEPQEIADMVDRTRAMLGNRIMPILFNEDDHYDFDREENNFAAAVTRRASWGYLDIGENNYCDGYQSPPVNWGLSTER